MRLISTGNPRDVVETGGKVGNSVPLIEVVDKMHRLGSCLPEQVEESVAGAVDEQAFQRMVELTVFLPVLQYGL